MPASPSGPAKLLLAFCAGAAALWTCQPAPLQAAPLDDAWEKAATFLFDDAHAEFLEQKGQPHIDERERLLGDAVTRMNVQPRTVENIALAQKALQSLVAANGSDQAGVFAQYFLGRIYQYYDDPPRLDDARKIYHQLIDQHSGIEMAEAAAIPLITLDLYGEMADEERARRFAALERIAPQLKTSSGRRDYHASMGLAYVDFRLDHAKALEHLVAADREGFTARTTESIVWVAIGELARAENQVPLAAEYYQKFLAKYARDDRHFTVQKHFESLPQVAN